MPAAPQGAFGAAPQATPGQNGFGYAQAGPAGQAEAAGSVFDQRAATGEYAQPGWQQQATGWSPQAAPAQPAADPAATQSWPGPQQGGWGTGQHPVMGQHAAAGQQNGTGQDPVMGQQGMAGQYPGAGQHPVTGQYPGAGQYPATGPQQAYGAAPGQATQAWAAGEHPRQEPGQDFGRAGYGQGLDAFGAQQAAYGQDQRGGALGYPQDGTDPRWSAPTTGASTGEVPWPQGPSYGNAGLPAGAGALGQTGYIDNQRTEAFPGEWPMAGGYQQGGHTGDQGLDGGFLGDPGDRFGATGDPRYAARAERPDGERNKPAGAALLFAIIGFVIPVVPAIIALVLASKAARRIRESAGAIGGRGLVSAARVLGSLGLVTGVVAAAALGAAVLRGGLSLDSIGAGASDRGSQSPSAQNAPEQGQGGEQGVVKVAALEVGNCIADAPKAEVLEVKLVECKARHESEVFANVAVEGDELPARDELDALAEERCVSAFNDYVGVDYNKSALNIRYITPTKESWAQGDRSITCTLTGAEPGEKLTGSKKDTKK